MSPRCRPCFLWVLGVYLRGVRISAVFGFLFLDFFVMLALEECMVMIAELERLHANLKERCDWLEQKVLEERRLALCMAYHPRLGSATQRGVSCLPEDILCTLLA